MSEMLNSSLFFFLKGTYVLTCSNPLLSVNLNFLAQVLSLLVNLAFLVAIE